MPVRSRRSHTPPRALRSRSPSFRRGRWTRHPATPLGPGEIHTQQITGGVGQCVGAIAIPSSATAVTSTPFVVAVEEPSGSHPLTTTPEDVLMLQVPAPADGKLTVMSYAKVQHVGGDGSDVFCAILEAGEPGPVTVVAGPYLQLFEATGMADDGTLSGTRVFELAAGEEITVGLRCRETDDGATINGRTLTGLFPAV